MTLEKEKRFLLLLASYKIGKGASKSDVLDEISDNCWITLCANELEMKTNRNELVWRNDLAFVRKHLVQNGSIVSGIRNDWSITDSGIKELCELFSEVTTTDANELKK